MELAFTEKFKKDYKKLALVVQRQTDEKLEFFAEKPFHNSFRIKKMQGKQGIYEASINMQYRFLFQIDGSTCFLLRIGTHDILEK
ncbi:MAG: type II toxin-antitoxin system mRNA interferase toxin, RelE/StbE family [Candidatus Pacebacteria bacterium]|nr:type II toxin-antitoxin system mRNA interferase toxin, RelE/StbE family [Candidatus Paceibacterota bacterium]